MQLKELLEYAINNNASDVHLSSSHPPIFRIHGDIIQLRTDILRKEELKELIYSMMNQQQQKDYELLLDLDFAIHFNNTRFRINVFNTLNGPACVLRSIPSVVKTLSEINAPLIISNLTKLDRGLILVTGPTGSGKSTTVAAMIDHINKNFQKHILTIEDPIEFVHKSKKSIINQREIPTHSKSFAKALRSALREDPDVILVGELRDLETIQLALTAAETGHLVIATLHTSSAAQTVNRVIDVFPSDDKDMIRIMLSNSIEAVISQQLVKNISKDNRIPAFEILTATSAVRNLIREGKIAQIHSLMQINSKYGMCIMKDSINELINKNLIDPKSAKILLNISENDDLIPKLNNNDF